MRQKSSSKRGGAEQAVRDIRRAIALGSRFAATPDDTQDVRTEKTAIFLVASACCLAGLAWSASYQIVFGWGLVTALPLIFVAVVGSSLVISNATKDHRFAVYAQIISIILIPAFIQWSVGGFFDSGFVIVWALLGPLVALMFLPITAATPWFGLFLAALLVTVGFNSYFDERGLEVSETTRQVFLGMNLSVSSAVVFGFTGYFVRSAISERGRANVLLRNVLPEQIAETLKEREGTIAEHHDSVSILFADIVGSTPLFADLEPGEVVDWLNEAFSAMDDVVERYGLEKIRTIGDNYMIGAGVPAARQDHALALTNCGLDIIDALSRIPARNGKRIRLRVGISSGTVVAGVIGKSKFHYDLWGDSANVASRMESHGEVDRVHVSRETYELIKDQFDCVPRGTISIKGKGDMETWFVTGRKLA